MKDIFRGLTVLTSLIKNNSGEFFCKLMSQKIEQLSSTNNLFLMIKNIFYKQYLRNKTLYYIQYFVNCTLLNVSDK